MNPVCYQVIPSLNPFSYLLLVNQTLDSWLFNGKTNTGTDKCYKPKNKKRYV